MLESGKFFVWDINPIIFKFGFIELRYYGLFFATGIIVAYYIALKIFRERNIPEELLDRLTIYLVIGIVLGAHFVHLIFYEPSAFYRNPIRIVQLGMGLASHGGGLGAMLAGYLFCRKYKIPFFKMADSVIIGGALTTSFVRLGNFFNSEILGRPSDVPWAVIFARIDFLPRHPSQLYEVAMGIILFLILWLFYKKLAKTRPNGFIFFSFLAIYFSMRFVVEFFKDNQSEFTIAEQFITMGQWLSIPFVLVSLYMLFVKGYAYSSKKKKEK